MKRALSMLVAIAMILSMVPSVFAASETATVLTDIAQIAVNLTEDNGYYAEYSWTPAEDGEMSLYQYTDLNIEMILAQGGNTATSYSKVDGVANYSFAVSMAVVAGEEVTIEFINSEAAAQSFTAYGNFVGQPGKSQDNPIALNAMESTVTNSGKLWYQGYFSGTTMTVTGEGDFTVTYNGVDTAAVEGVVSMDVTSANPRMPVVFALTGEGEYSITFTYPVGTQMNPEVLFRPNYIAVSVEEGNNQGYYYKWTATADGELVLTCPAAEGVEYDVNMTNMTTYEQVWLQDSTDGTITLAVSAGDEVIIQIAAMPDASWNIPALEVALTGEFVYPVGTQMNPEVIFRPNYIAVNIEAGNNQGYFYKWTATADGELILTCPTVEGVDYDVNMTNMSTYVQAWLQDSTDGTVTLAVSAGDEVIIQIAAIPDASWNIPALEVALTGEFVYPVGTQMNPEVLESLEMITVAIEAGNNQGYFFKWVATADGQVKLACPTTNGVTYGVDLINMSTNAQAWLQDSTDGTVTLAVSAGDEVIIHVAAVPDASWDYPALNIVLYANALPTGWTLENGNWAYYANGVRFANTWQKDSKGWCYLGADGYMVYNTWAADSKGMCYVGADGYMVVNKWVEDSNGWAYVDNNGYMVKNAWVKDTVGWCYLGADGYMVTNSWQKDSKGWCYLGADGRMVVNKWVKDSIGWCYVDASGYIVYNQWVKDHYGWCYVGGSGYMVYNQWVKDSIGWCFIGADGYMIYNDVVYDLVNEKIYYIDVSGYMVSNQWIGGGNAWVYFGNDGAAVISDWVFYQGNWYYIGDDGLMLYNTSAVIGGKTYNFNASGVCTNP